jgi:hypothetical protein
LTNKGFKILSGLADAIDHAQEKKGPGRGVYVIAIESDKGFSDSAGFAHLIANV